LLEAIALGCLLDELWVKLELLPVFDQEVRILVLFLLFRTLGAFGWGAHPVAALATFGWHIVAIPETVGEFAIAVVTAIASVLVAMWKQALMGYRQHGRTARSRSHRKQALRVHHDLDNTLKKLVRIVRDFDEASNVLPEDERSPRHVQLVEMLGRVAGQVHMICTEILIGLEELSVEDPRAVSNVPEQGRAPRI
jgi:hypothetical protein